MDVSRGTVAIGCVIYGCESLTTALARNLAVLTAFFFQYFLRAALGQPV